MDDVLIALVDGLAGGPEAITTDFPPAQVHHCVVHLVRSSLGYVNWKDRKLVAAALRAIYRAPTEDAALAALAPSRPARGSTRYAPIGTMWRRHWPHVRPVFAYPPEIRKLLYDERDREPEHAAAQDHQDARPLPERRGRRKLLYLALRSIRGKWRTASAGWRRAMPHLAVLFGERFHQALIPVLRPHTQKNG